ncbi:MAG: D-alanyl-D-alanine carboxypeptidase family protein [Clostridia bacterium]|nr:D-alanyl-D-alanine carboxypeptidase family protein [Clostridia bacterium]
MADFDRNSVTQFEDAETTGSEAESTMARRAERKRMQKIAFLTAAALVALTLLMLLILIIGAIVKNAKGPSGEHESNDLPADKLQWTTITMTADEMNRGSLILSTETNTYSLPDDDASLVKLYDYRAEKHPGSSPYKLAGIGTLMNGTALSALDNMLSDCSMYTACSDVTIRIAFMTTAEQKEYKSSLREHALDYKTGLGCDMVLNVDSQTRALTTNERVYNWLVDNCAKYGFILRYPADKTEKTGVADYATYFRYVGVAHATYIKANGLSLEEYLELLSKSTTSKDPLKVTGLDGKPYEIHWNAANGSVYVPKNYAYEVSGTNMGGVVVTIDRSTLLQPTEEPTGTESGTTAEIGTEQSTSPFVGN